MGLKRWLLSEGITWKHQAGTEACMNSTAADGGDVDSGGGGGGDGGGGEGWRNNQDSKDPRKPITQENQYFLYF